MGLEPGSLDAHSTLSSALHATVVQAAKDFVGFMSHARPWTWLPTNICHRHPVWVPVFFRRAPAARKSASDDRFTAGARSYLSRRPAPPARAHIASDGVTVPARWPSRATRAAPSFRRRW